MGIKDMLISTGAEKFLKSYISDFGELKDFSIDTSGKTITLKVNLEGEPETFTLQVLSYRVIESAGKTYISVDDVSTSKKWMNIIFNKYFKGQKIEVPEKYVSYLKFIQ